MHNQHTLPVPGDIVRTKKMQMEGTVEKVEPYLGIMSVYFRIQDGRLMRTPADNVTVIEKLEDNSVSESFPYDVDHMPGPRKAVHNNNETVKFFYQEWKQLANHINALNYDDNLEIISTSDYEIYQTESGKLIAKWDKKQKRGTISSLTQEGMMGGINRCAPAQDVSYEKVLDEIKERWEKEKLNELSVEKLRAYKDAAKSSEVVKHSPLMKIAKHTQGAGVADKKIRAKTGNRVRATYETYNDRLSTFLEDDFSNILQKQHDTAQAGKKKPIKDIPFHGWTIRYRPASGPGEKVAWMVLDKKHVEKHRGESMTDRDAVGDAEEWIKSGGGTKQEANSKVTIDFNVDFAKEFCPGGEPLYIQFDHKKGFPYMFISLEPKNGFKKTHARNQKHKMTSTTIPLPMVGLSANESNAAGLQPNGRYLLDNKEPIDDTMFGFSLIFQGTVQGKGDMVKMGKPGLTVAHSRDIDEDYRGPWLGDAEKYEKAPKSSMQGKENLPLSELVKDSIETHGIKWAFDYYVNKNGMPPRHFRIYAGL